MNNHLENDQVTEALNQLRRALSHDACAAPYSSESTTNSRITLLWIDMRERWAQGIKTRIEDYLSQDQLQDDALILDLVYAEYSLREQNGEAPTVSQYIDRFPHLASQLGLQFAIHSELSDVSDSFAVEEDQESIDLPENLTPDFIGKYRVISKIASGSQADVYRGVHPLLGQDVTIKVGRTKVGEPSRHALLLQEGRILALLDHPNLARVFDLGIEDGRVFLVMQHIPGLNLEQFARQRRLSGNQAAQLVAKIARGVAAVHARGILHRDIKPGNIVVDAEGEPWLIDFGLSDLLSTWNDPQHRPSSLSGTVAYMSPEQANCSPQIDHRADIFALGGVLYFLLTGCAPFEAASFPEALTKAQKCDWDPLTLKQLSIAPMLETICRKAMAVQPQNRYVSADELAGELEACHSPASDNKGRFVRIVTAGLVVFAGVLFYAFGRGDSESQSTDIARLNQTSSSVNVGAVEPALNLTVEFQRNGRFFDVGDIAPVATGEIARIQIQIPANFHSALFVVDAACELTLLQKFPATPQEQIVSYPDDAQAVPLVGPPGTEFVFACARNDGEIEVEDITEKWKSDKAWPKLPELCVLHLDSTGVRTKQTDRGFGTPVDHHDTETMIRTRLMEFGTRIRREYPLLNGIAYSHVE